MKIFEKIIIIESNPLVLGHGRTNSVDVYLYFPLDEGYNDVHTEILLKLYLSDPVVKNSCLFTSSTCKVESEKERI